MAAAAPPAVAPAAAAPAAAAPARPPRDWSNVATRSSRRSATSRFGNSGHGSRVPSEATSVTRLVSTPKPEPGSGFGTETNRVAILSADGARDDLPLLTKREVADRLLDRVTATLDARAPQGHTGATTREAR